MRYSAIKERVESIPGWLMGGQEEWLFSTAKHLKDKSVIVEIGSYKGRSTSALAFGCVGTEKSLFTIDIFDVNGSGYPYVDFLENIERLNLLNYMTVLPGYSAEIAEVWENSIRLPIDFLFIDGCHDCEIVMEDYDRFSEYVIPGGLIAVHDVYCAAHPGCTEAWNKIKGDLKPQGACKSIAFGYKL